VAGKKRKKQRSRQRQSFAPASARPISGSGAEGSPAASPAAAPATGTPAAPAGRGPSTPSSAGITGPRRPLTPAAAGTIDIDARVPYFTADLRRVLITAAVMVVLIVVGSLLIH
jgi:hypothetical protein